VSLPRIRSHLKKMTSDQKVQIRIRIQDLIEETKLEERRTEVRDAVMKAIEAGLGDMEIIAIAHQVVSKAKRSRSKKKS